MSEDKDYKEIAREIVQSYMDTGEVSAAVGGRLIRIATSRAEETFYTSFEHQYEYIADLVEFYRRERAFFRLEDKLKDSDTENSELIGVNQSIVDLDEVNNCRVKKRLSLDDIMSTLNGNLSENHLKIIKQLLEPIDKTQAITFDLTVDQIYNRISDIIEDLDIIHKLYSAGGELHLPNRQILYIQLCPSFKIVFRGNGFNKYGMNETDKKLDAIDQVGGLRDYLQKEYLQNGRSSYDIAEELDVHSTTVRTWIRKFQIPLRTSQENQLPKGVSKPTKEQLSQEYWQESMSTYDLSEKYGVDNSTVFRWLKGYDIKRRSLSDSMKLAKRR